MIWTTDDFKALGVGATECGHAAAFGGAIENSPAGWQAYINAHPAGWRLPLITAWLLHARRIIHCPDLIWRVARIAFREQPEANAQLRVYAETLGPDTWREAQSAAAAYAADAYAAYAYAAYAAYAYAVGAAAVAAAYAADAAVAAAAAAAVAAVAVGAAVAVADAVVGAAVADGDARKRVKAEIIAMAVEELQAVPV